jgi:ornithine carbamoyltransferase
VRSRKAARSIISVADLSRTELEGVLERAASIKKAMDTGRRVGTLEGMVIGLLFEKPSTRTRVSFESAALRMGGHPVYMSAGELQLSRGEPIDDTSVILGGYLDAIVARVYSNSTVEGLARHSGVPVINALSDTEHPTQIVSDLLTMREAKGKLKSLKLAYVGDGNNVCNSLLLGCALQRMRVSVACPAGYEPEAGVVRKAEGLGGEVEVVDDPAVAVADADFVYTDVWVSMGDESEKEERMKRFSGYKVDAALMKGANRDAKVMHCLPAHRGLEISGEMLDGPISIAWEQGRNKLFGAAASMEFVLRGLPSR